MMSRDNLDLLVAAYSTGVEQEVNIRQEAPRAEYVHGVTSVSRAKDGRRVGSIWTDDGVSYVARLDQYLSGEKIDSLPYYGLPDYRTALMVLLSRAAVEKTL